MDKMIAYREQLNQFDRRLIDVLAERLKINQQIRLYKAAHQLPVVDKKRESELLCDRMEYAEKMGIDPKLAEDLFQTILTFVTK